MEGAKSGVASGGYTASTSLALSTHNSEISDGSAKPVLFSQYWFHRAQLVDCVRIAFFVSMGQSANQFFNCFFLWMRTSEELGEQALLLFFDPFPDT